MSNEIPPRTITRFTPYDDLPQYTTVQEAAAFLGVSEWSIRRMVHTGELERREFGPKLIFIEKRSLAPSWHRDAQKKSA